MIDKINHVSIILALAFGCCNSVFNDNIYFVSKLSGKHSNKRKSKLFLIKGNCNCSSVKLGFIFVATWLLNNP